MMKERKRRKRKEDMGWDPNPLGEKLKERRDCHTQGSPFTGGKISSNRGGASGAIRGKYSSWPVAGRTE